MEAGGLGGYSPKSAETGSTDWHCPPPPHPGKAPAGPPFPLLWASVPAPTAAASSPPDCIRTWPEACRYCHGARSCTGMSQARPHRADPLEGTRNNAKVDRPHRCDMEGEAEQWSRTLTGASSGALGGQALEEQAEEARSRASTRGQCEQRQFEDRSRGLGKSTLTDLRSWFPPLSTRDHDRR